MTATTLNLTQTSEPTWLKLGYLVVGAVLLAQICSTVYATSLSLRDNQKLAMLQAEKQVLVIQAADLDRTIAKRLAIKPIQTALSAEFVPITKFLTASQHLTVASR